MKTKLLYLGMALFGVLQFAACSSESEVVDPNNNEVPGNGEEEPAAWEITETLVLTDGEKALSNSLSAFEDKLIDKVLTPVDKENPSVGPLSMSIYLGMMSNIVDAETHGQIMQLVGARDAAAYNSYCEKLMHFLPSEKDGVKAGIANRIWLANRYNAKENIPGLLRKHYNADLVKTDFGKPDAVQQINKWVDESTDGLIKQIVDTQDWQTYVSVPLFSANAMFLRATWARKFDKANTADKVFNGVNSKANVPTMKDETLLEYATTDYGQMVILRLGDGSNVLELYLPAEGKDVLCSQAQRDLMRSKAALKRVKLYLPKFQVTGNYEATEILADMGLKNIGALGLLLNEPMDKQALKVFQNYFLNVNEDGAEMAVATWGVVTDGPDTDLEKEVTVDFNRPFMYVLRNQEHNVNLLAGIINQL